MRAKVLTRWCGMATPQGVAYGEWSLRIREAHSVRDVMGTLRDYLSAWTVEQISLLPYDIGARTLIDPEHVAVRALLASQIELRTPPQDEAYPFIREMSLVLAAAAARIRYLQTLASVSLADSH